MLQRLGGKAWEKVILEYENAEGCVLLLEEEPVQGSSYTLAWLLKERVEVCGRDKSYYTRGR